MLSHSTLEATVDILLLLQSTGKQIKGDAKSAGAAAGLVDSSD